MTDLSRSCKLHIEQICSDYEADWSPGSVEQIEAYVSRFCGAPASRDSLIEELIAVDSELVSINGGTPTSERYERLPEAWHSFIQSIVAQWNSVATSTSMPCLPSRIGDYRIIRELGRGGMGVVYEAVQDGLERHVAVKALVNSAVSQFAMRFEKEARAIARLHHTNITEVYGTGIHEGQPFYAMQLVKGGDLCNEIKLSRNAITDHQSSGSPRSKDDLILLGPESIRNIADIGVSAALALQHAHDHGVLHRDVKPSNLLLDENNTPLLSDFGLARLMDEESDDTRSNAFIGTLRYAAPELIRGEADSRSDVYSLGLTLYEMLTLQPAFKETNHSQLVEAINRGAVHSVRSIDGSIPVDLDTIVRKATDYDASARYQSASDLAADLQRFLDGVPVIARRASPLERSFRWIRRNPAQAGLLATSGIIAFIGFPLLFTLWVAAADQRDVATLALKTADRESRKAEAAWNGLQTMRKQAVDEGYAYSMQLAQRYLEDARPLDAKRILDRWRNDEGLRRRGWEWHYLNRRLDCSKIVFPAQVCEHVFDVDFCPDGKRIVSVENDLLIEKSPGQVVVWNRSDGRKLRTMTSPGMQVLQAAISPDGERVVAVGFALPYEEPANRRCMARLWNLNSADPEPLRSVVFDKAYPTMMNKMHRRYPLPSVEYSSDGKRIIFGAAVEIRDSETLAPLSKPSGDHFVSSDGDEYFVVTDRTLAQRSLTTSQDLQQVSFSNPVGQISLSNTGSLLAADMSHSESAVFIWDRSTELSDFRHVPLPRFGIAKISPCGDYFVRSADDGRLVFRTTKSNSTRDTQLFGGHTSTITQIAFCRDGTTLATASMDGTARIWDLGQLRSCYSTNYTCDRIASIAFGNDGKSLRSVSRTAQDDTNAVSFDFASTEPDSSTQFGSPKLTRMAKWPRKDIDFSPTGKLLAGPMSERTQSPQPIIGHASAGKLGIWDASTWSLQRVISDLPAELYAVCWSADEQELVVAGCGSIQVYDLSDARPPNCVGTLKIDEVINVVKVKDDFLVFGTDSKTKIFQRQLNQKGVITFKELAEFPTPAIDVSFSPDARRIAIADRAAGKFAVYDTSSLTLLYEKPAPRRVTSLTHSPDGRRIALTGYDGLVDLRDAKNGLRLLSLRGNDVPPGDMAVSAKVIFSDDGRTLATNNWMGEIRFWRTH